MSLEDQSMQLSVESDDDSTESDHVIKVAKDPLDEDVYGAGISSIVRDTHKLHTVTANVSVRYGRLVATSLLIFTTIGLQLWLISEFKTFVTSISVHDIRNVYSDYEKFMYEQTEINENGYLRGVKGTWKGQEHFHQMSKDIKISVCEIPFSQPKLIVPILLIWTVTVVSHLRRTADIFYRLVCATPTVHQLSEVIEESEDSDHESTIIGLTALLKTVITFFILIPRAIISLVLLWLGCRWLVATTSFGDLVLNAVALEFIIALKDLFFIALIPQRHRRETQTTLMMPWYKTESASLFSYLSSFGLIFVSIVWVSLYMFPILGIGPLQQVLPDYRWDVHDACKGFIEKISKI